MLSTFFATIVFSSFLGSLTPGTAVCASIDTQHDTLTPNEQKAAIKLFESSLRQKGLTVVPAPCPYEFRLYHLKLGQSIQVIVQGPDRERMGKAPAVEELPSVYSQLAGSIVLGTEPGSELSTGRDAVTSDQANPRRIKADNIWYLTLGGGSVFGGQANWGTRFSAGYRHELNQLAIDVSVMVQFALNQPESDDDDDGGGVSGSLIRLQGLWFFNPLEAQSLYLGGGFSWGGVALNDNNQTYTGSGLQGELTAGYSFLRSTTIRFFVEGNATLPFYRSDDAIFDAGVEDKDFQYTPVFGLSLGLGF